MKHFNTNTVSAISVFVLAVMVSCNQTSEPTDADMTELKQHLSEYNNVLNTHDRDATAEFYMEDADFTYPIGTWIKGKKIIPGLMKGRQRDYEIEDMRFLDAQTAIVNFNNHFSGTDDNGNAIPDDWNSSTVVLRKQDGKWKTAATRILNARITQEEAEAGIKQSWDNFLELWEKGDAEGTIQFFTANTINMVPGRNSDINREGVLSNFKSFLADNMVQDFKRTMLELDVIGRTAYEYGLFEQTIVPAKGKPATSKTRYCSVWKLEADNVWRIHRFIFNEYPGDADS